MKRSAHACLLAVGLILAPHAPSGRAGVLLGLEWLQADGTGWDPLPQRLTTYWITGDGSGARIERSMTGLVLPQANGFSRLSIRRSCTVDREAPEKPFDECQDEYVAADLSAPLPARPSGQYEDDGPCLYGVVRIDFASPLAVALRIYTGNNETCEPRGYHWSEYAWVQPVAAKYRALADVPGRDPGHIRLSAFAGPKAAAAYASALEKTAAQNSKEMDGRECENDPEADDQWTLARSRGQWKPTTFQAEFPPCYLVEDIAVPLPAKFTGPDRLAVPWASLVNAVPGAADAVSSPDGAWTLVLTPSQLVFVPGRDLSRKTVLPLPNRAAATESASAVRLIMAQWAVGDRNVARWSSALASAGAIR